MSTVTPLQNNGVQGKLVVGTGTCDGLGCLPDYTGDPSHPAYLAVFPLPENDKGLKIIGLETLSMSKEDFLKVLSTFRQIE